MKKRKLLNSYSLSEKVLISLAVVLMTTLIFKTATTNGTWIDLAFADESSSDSSEGSSKDDSKSSSDDEKSSSDDSKSSSDDEKSSSNDENSIEYSVREDRMEYSEETAEGSIEISTIMKYGETEISVEDDEGSLEASIKDDELSVEKSYGIFSGGAAYEGMFDEGNFEDVVEFETGEKLVRRQEKLFFLIPVEIESTVTVDESGMITAVQQSLLQRILSWFSF